MDAPNLAARLWGRLRWWWRGRDWRLFLLGLPALSCGAGVALMAVACLNTPARETEARYLTEGKSAFQAKDYPRALTCFERLAPGADDRPEVFYRLALTAEALGDSRRAVSLMRRLAPDPRCSTAEDRRGYAPAHFWWARQLLNAAAATPRATDATDEAEVHLVQALDGELEDRERAHGLLGDLYLRRGLKGGRLADAELHLGKAVTTRPIFRLSLARLYALRQDLPRARHEAEQAARFFRDRAQSDLGNLQARLAWVDALTFLEDFPTAVAALLEGGAATQAPVYRLALGRVYAAWFDARKRQPGASAGELLDLLDKGLTQDPASQDLLNRLLGQIRVAGPEADQARAVLRGLLAKGGTALAPIHFALAVDARTRGDAEAERLHLELAFRLDPKTGLIANNLAWVVSQAPHPDLPRALDLVNPAVEWEPDNPTYRDTRGHIYLAMGRWLDALTDLEVVLRRAPNTAGLHTALAQAYDKLGQAADAAEHRRLASEPHDDRGPAGQ
jgi:hypothetical protein